MEARGGDIEVMRAFAQREPSAADELYRRFGARLFGLGMVMLRDRALAEDLVQDTFVKAWLRAETFDPGRGALDKWMLMIGRSLAIDALRRRGLEARSMSTLKSWPDLQEEPGPEGYVENQDMVARARRVIASLPAGQRRALELAYFGAKTAQQIARLEGIPVGTAKSRIRDGLRKLRGALGVTAQSLDTLAASSLPQEVCCS